MAKGNLLCAHGGGPTAVMNASLFGVIREAEKHGQIDGVIGARFGIEGVLREQFTDLRRLSAQNLRLLPFTPASLIGSCRRKLEAEDYPRLMHVFRKHNIRYFLYNGGNDSMDTCDKVAGLAKRQGYDMSVVGIPKTIDNDLDGTDHCPGFGSAARYAAVSAMDLTVEAEALPIHVIILEVMGRNTGWLAASTVLARQSEHAGPHLIYLPERPFSHDGFLNDVDALHRDVKGIVVCVSEGLVNQEGTPVADAGITDGFGHRVPGGVAQSLSHLLISQLGIKSRAEKPGLLGRASSVLQSSVDRAEAVAVGEYGVAAAVSGKSGVMVAILRECDDPYRCSFGYAPLDKVANAERKFPDEWINARGNGIDKRFAEYCLPLLGDPLPQYARLPNRLP